MGAGMQKSILIAQMHSWPIKVSTKFASLTVMRLIRFSQCHKDL